MFYDIINKKRKGEALTHGEIDLAVRGFTNGDMPDYQMSALLMAICLRGMTDEETAYLTDSMIHTGRVMHLHDEIGGICIDKHSTGGVGDKMTLIDGPLLAACGVYVPKMSGRGLGHTGGTIDKLSAIPGMRTDLSHMEFITTVREAGFGVMSQTADMVPADKKMYALRDLTATVESIPLIASSVMSKKLATGADGIVLDVKVGDGAFMKDEHSARQLADACAALAESYDMPFRAVLTDMEKPLGRCVGNALEVAEACDYLMGKNVSPDVEEVSRSISAAMLGLAGKETSLIDKAISSGKAFERFEKMVELQHGDPHALTDHSLMGVPRYEEIFTAPAGGRITAVKAEAVGLAALALGAGRKKLGDDIDPTAGIFFERSVGDEVSAGETVARMYSSSVTDMSQARALLESALCIGG
ncbi:MAG: thymidine phosphorylase [Oscillospiraceae bacterium]|nr:thymidine phosphorylase [Oscillospiraceae bacterium]